MNMTGFRHGKMNPFSISVDSEWGGHNKSDVAEPRHVKSSQKSNFSLCLLTNMKL
jgi:hypothetical protein